MVESDYGRLLHVKSLSDHGYRRYRCKVCGAYFWSRVPRDTCNDVPCTNYSFFNMKLNSPPLTVGEARDKFLNFFKRHGHEVIEPKPVVARWREDLYLTIASIVVFQPHVTSGIVPPPSNPLVIAQPCIRLEDIDSVGYTLGRHLTNFIMGGHHAFNYPDKFIYFTEETVEYAKEFFTKEVGVPEDELTFKESWWEGGGDAGPSFEVCVGGLEVATLVFMIFKSVDGGYRELPLKIVDTGYGIERISWLTSRTPTAFHSIYRDLVPRYCKLLEMPEAPPNVLWEAIKLIGNFNVKNVNDFMRFGEAIASRLGMDLSDVLTYINGAVRVFTLLDHVKTAILLLADGVVPSNAGEGYLARLVLRRIFRLLKILNKEDVVDDLFKLQVDYWMQLYPNVGRARDYIADVLNVELSKFNEVLSRSLTTLRNYILKGGRGLGTEDLIELYDSHGLPPEIVVEEARKAGVDVYVPPDFYSLITSRHSRPPIKASVRSKLPQDVIKRFSTLQPTKYLFHEDPYLREFKAKVLGIEGKYVVLDQTAFYPEGGGQEADVGVLVFPNNLIVDVVDVQKAGNVIVHVINTNLPSEYVGAEVVGKVDWARRYSLMRHHTATHIILAAARKVLGSHVWQAGAEKSEEGGRLDITHYKQLSEEEVGRIEEIANSIVDEGIEVRVRYLPRYEAEKAYGFTLYQGGVPLEPVIRVVEIPGIDAQACFGTHLRNTREVGGIKIVSTQRIQDGVVRFEYKAGTQLVSYVRSFEKQFEEARALIGGGDIVKRLRTLTQELRDIKALLNRYRSKWVEFKSNEILNSLESVDDVKYGISVIDIPDKEALRDLLKSLTTKLPELVIVALMPEDLGRVYIEISVGSEATSKIRATDIVNEVVKMYGGRGGGRETHASGHLGISGDLSEVVKGIRGILLKLIKS